MSSRNSTRRPGGSSESLLRKRRTLGNGRVPRLVVKGSGNTRYASIKSFNTARQYYSSPLHAQGGSSWGGGDLLNGVLDYGRNFITDEALSKINNETPFYGSSGNLPILNAVIRTGANTLLPPTLSYAGQNLASYLYNNHGASIDRGLRSLLPGSDAPDLSGLYRAGNTVIPAAVSAQGGSASGAINRFFSAQDRQAGGSIENAIVNAGAAEPIL